MDKKALEKFSYGLYVLGVKSDKGYYGGCIIDAVAQLDMAEKPTVVCSSMKQNESNRLVHKFGEFTLSVLPEDVDPFVIANFGFQSARDVEKWPNVDFVEKDGLPYLAKAISHVRLRVTDAIELSTHTAFVCETVDAFLGEAGGAPLIYADYFTKLKDAAMTAFSDFKKR
jgi:flavin reductase (DIM6/NTAB) family NADH-FMN oxidoreductase RutF